MPALPAMGEGGPEEREGAMPDNDPTTATEPIEPTAPPPATTEPPASSGDTLGDAGKVALESERRARRDAENAVRKATAELETLRTANLSDTEKAVAAARKEGERSGLRRLVEAEARAQAAGKLANPQLASRLLDLDQFMPAEGEDVDGERIAEAIEQLVTAEPYLRVSASTPPAAPPVPTPTGTAPAGARGAGAPVSFTRSQLRDHQFYEANKEAILLAASEGRITES